MVDTDSVLSHQSEQKEKIRVKIIKRKRVKMSKRKKDKQTKRQNICKIKDKKRN
jgi:hypothetical protein